MAPRKTYGPSFSLRICQYFSYHVSSPHDSDVGEDITAVADQTQPQEEKEDQDFAQALVKLQFPNLYLESDQAADSVSPQGLSIAPLQEYDPLYDIFLIISYFSKI